MGDAHDQEKGATGQLDLEDPHKDMDIVYRKVSSPTAILRTLALLCFWLACCRLGHISISPQSMRKINQNIALTVAYMQNFSMLDISKAAIGCCTSSSLIMMTWRITWKYNQTSVHLPCALLCSKAVLHVS